MHLGPLALVQARTRLLPYTTHSEPLQVHAMCTHTHTLMHCSTHLGPLALVQARTRLLPYTTWNVRPTGGKNGKTVAVTLGVPGLQELVIFEVRVPITLPV